MKIVKILGAAGIALTLTACAIPHSLHVTEFNGSSVRIRGDHVGIKTKDQKLVIGQELQALADETCSRGSRKNAEYVSRHSLIPNGVTGNHSEFLFICVN